MPLLDTAVLVVLEVLFVVPPKAGEEFAECEVFVLSSAVFLKKQCCKAWYGAIRAFGSYSSAKQGPLILNNLEVSVQILLVFCRPVRLSRIPKYRVVSLFPAVGIP